MDENTIFRAFNSDEAVNCKVALSKKTIDILEQMSEEDHVSITTEIENAISGWYRFRHGFTGLEEKDKEIKDLQNDLLRARIKAQQDMVFSSLKTPPTYLETGP